MTDLSGEKYAILILYYAKSVQQVRERFTNWNIYQLSDTMKVMPVKIAGQTEDILTFGVGENIKNNETYAKVMAEQLKKHQGESNTYKEWTADGTTLAIGNKRKKVVQVAADDDDSDSPKMDEDSKYKYEFSRTTKQSFDALTIAEAQVNADEVKWMTTDEGCIAGTWVGNVYAAKNPIFGLPVKIGATVKASPYMRLKELSSCLPHSFQLLTCIQTTNPFALEKKVHDHFAAFSIEKDNTNRNTKFFMVTEDDVHKYFEELMQEPCL